MIRCRKIPPSARFSLPAAVFHWNGQYGNRTTGPVKKTRVADLSFLHYCILGYPFNFQQKNMAEQGTDLSHRQQPLLSKI